MTDELRENSWVSANTRAVIFETLIYAPSDHWGYNLLVEVSLLAEFSPTGAVIASGSVRALRLWLYYGWRDYMRLWLELLVSAYVVYQFRQEARQLSAIFAQQKQDAALSDNKRHFIYRRAPARESIRLRPEDAAS